MAEYDSNVYILSSEDKKSTPIIRALSISSFVAVLIVNYALGVDNASVSKKFFLRVTPPGVFFSIWALIFILTGITLIYNTYYNKWKNSSRSKR